MWRITCRKKAIIIARPDISQNRSMLNILEIEANQISGLINMALKMQSDNFAQPRIRCSRGLTYNKRTMRRLQSDVRAISNKKMVHTTSTVNQRSIKLIIQRLRIVLCISFVRLSTPSLYIASPRISRRKSIKALE